MTQDFIGTSPIISKSIDLRSKLIYWFLRWEKPSQNLELIFVLVKILCGNLWKIGPSRATGFIFDKREKEGLTSPLVRFNARYISPNDPLPIFRISLYLPPTTNSDLVVDAILWILKYYLKFF